MTMFMGDCLNGMKAKCIMTKEIWLVIAYNRGRDRLILSIWDTKEAAIKARNKAANKKIPFYGGNCYQYVDIYACPLNEEML